MCKFSCYNWFGNISGIIGCGSIYFSWIFSRECTTSMRSPTSICINYNLSSSKTSIGFWTSNFEASWRINDELCVLKHFSRANFLNNFFSNCSSNLFISNTSIMLSRYKNVINSHWLNIGTFFSVFNDDLGFAVGSEPWNSSTMSSISKLFTEFISKVVRVWMQELFVPFICGIAKH